jgi:hypothetical protein
MFFVKISLAFHLRQVKLLLARRLLKMNVSESQEFWMRNKNV